LIEEEIEGAVTEAADRIGHDITDYTVTPIFPGRPEARGYHLFVIEFSEPIEEGRIETFARALDAGLSARNQDYREHRSGDFGMAPPVVRAVRPGAFADWMKARGRSGGQNKVPRVIHDVALFRSLEESLRHTDATCDHAAEPPVQ
jgi:hypothetical protein